MTKIGNLFLLAETQLIKEKQAGKIPYYDVVDIIDYAKEIRQWLDNFPKKIKEIMKLTPEQIKQKNRQYRKEYYLKKGK